MVQKHLHIPHTLQIGIVDDHPLCRVGLQCFLSSIQPELDFEISGEFSSGDDFITAYKGNPQAYDIVFLDLNLPGSDGLEVLEKCKQSKPRTKFIVFTLYNEPKVVKSTIKAGADGYLLKSSGIDEVLSAIETVLKGETFLGKDVTATIGVKRNTIDSKIHDQYFRKFGLTPRELEILELVSKAMNNKDIGQELYISDQTVGVHRKNIMRKLGVTSTAELIRMSYEMNLC